jgi:hypothetical protein
MKSVLVLAALALVPAAVAQSQTAPEGADAVALLERVGKTYATVADTFRIESIVDTANSSELRHDWTRVYRTAIKGPGNLYRIRFEPDSVPIFRFPAPPANGCTRWSRTLM